MDGQTSIFSSTISITIRIFGDHIVPTRMRRKSVSRAEPLPKCETRCSAPVSRIDRIYTVPIHMVIWGPDKNSVVGTDMLLRGVSIFGVLFPVISTEFRQRRNIQTNISGRCNAVDFLATEFSSYSVTRSEISVAVWTTGLAFSATRLLFSYEPSGGRLSGLTGILIVYVKDPHVPGERSARGSEPQLGSAGIHPGQIRPAASPGASAQRRVLRRQKAGLLLHKGNQHRGTVSVFRTRGAMSAQRTSWGKCESFLSRS